jgi:hypothetical protein
MRSLLGAPLGRLSDLGVDPDKVAAVNQSILLCFFDANQRPSRHCVRQLAQRHDRLGENGVIAVVVNVSAPLATTPDGTLKESTEALLVGNVKEDFQELRARWGIRSLPWLLLTDEDHVVQAEGFTISELDRKLETPRER